MKTELTWWLHDNRRAAMVCLICAIVLHTIRIHPTAHAETTDENAKIDDIREAIFRHQFAQIGTDSDKRVRLYFLSVGDSGSDPANSFLERFKDLNHLVKPVSLAQCVTNNLGIKCKDKTTGEEGFLFWVGTVKIISTNTSQADGNYWLTVPNLKRLRKFWVESVDGKWKAKEIGEKAHRWIPLEIDKPKRPDNTTG
ncbi:MAG: hypothetical protein HY043_01725 [Verrucomicrobia bacterium]|nr:hypothetical protein [Verrucomicrobiota bacterium]